MRALRPALRIKNSHRNEARAARPRWSARSGVLGRANSAAIRAPCVLVSHSTIAPGQRVVTPRRVLALRELRRLARLVQAGLLALDLARVAREEALALERDAQLRVRLDQRAGDPVAHGDSLSRQPAAVDAHAEVVLPLDAGDLERRDGDRLPDRAREVLLERAAVDPGGAAAGPEDDARDRGLALAGAAVLRDLAHCSVSSGFGF